MLVVYQDERFYVTLTAEFCKISSSNSLLMFRLATTALISLFLYNAFTGYSQALPATLLQGLQYRNVGPANQGGRIVDVEAQQDDFTKVFIATGSGGVWRSDNAGTSWKPIFDDYETASIGDIALDPQDPATIWVGTGEANNRNSVSWGNGVYVSHNGGESFVNKGLESTHQIARVLVHPQKKEEVCVCAIGHLWGTSGERGLFKTTDGGDSWQNLTKGLPDDGKTGCTDLLRDPKNPNILYAAFYERLRQPWTFSSGGPNGGIYKSTNGGKSWQKLTNGLPTGPTGRIGLALSERNPKILMALMEAERTDTLAIPGSGVYRSEDGGKSWKYVNTYNNRPFYYSQIRINPVNDQRVYLLTTRFMVSEDGGKTFRNGSEDEEVHGDFHAMWLDPHYGDRYYLGADKGFSLTHDHGQHFTLIDNLPIAQFYRINYDMRDPYYIYGGLQDNGSYATASFSRDARGILSDANWKMHWGDGQDAAANPYDYTDMYTSMEQGSYFKYNPQTRRLKRISPTPLNTINYWDHFDREEEDKVSAYRFNWSAPLVMSPHDPHHIFVGGNHVYATRDQGKTWKIISPDLSTNDPVKRQAGQSGGITPDNTGAETHCSIVGLTVSPISEEILWVGTDDGNVQVTRNGGTTWTNVRGNIPQVPEGIWVSRVIASRFQAGRAYVSFDGHRSDQLGTWIFVTEDFGQSWQPITKGFDAGESVRVIREDLVNENLLFAGTETGVWLTLDSGKNWQRLKLNMPTVSVYDLQIHPREHDLIVGTHGRSLWILDDISPLQQYSPALAEKPFHLFDQKHNTLWENVSRGGQRGHFWFAGENPASIENTSSVPRAAFHNLAVITYYVGATQTDSVELHIYNLGRTHHHIAKLSPTPGIHRYYWNREFAVEPYTPEELAQITAQLKDWSEISGNRRVTTAYQNFLKAETPYAQRKILEPLTESFLSFDLEDRFLIPKAEAGTYRVELRSGDQVEMGTLVIRDDPMRK